MPKTAKEKRPVSIGEREPVLHWTGNAQWEHWVYLALLIAAPLFVYLVNQNWTFQGLSHYDPWYYFGFFIHDLGYKPDNTNYAGERLAWNIPGHLLTSIFSAPIGAMLLNFICHALGLVLIYLLVRRFVDGRSGFLTAAMLATNPLYIGANGWNHVNGGSIVYMLLAFWALVRSHGARHAARNLILAGAAWACLLNVYFAWIILTPACLFVWLAGANRTLPDWVSSGDWRAVIGPVKHFTVGFAGLTALLAGIHTALTPDGTYYYFYFSLATARFVSTLSANPWSRGDFTWIREATWLLTPAVAALISAGALVIWGRRLNPAAKSLSWAYLCSLGIMVMMTLRQSRLLEFDYFATILLPTAYLALGVTAFRIPQGTKLWLTLPASLAGAALMGAALVRPGSFQWWLERGLLWPLLILAVSAGMYLVWGSPAWVATAAFYALGTMPLVPIYTRDAYAMEYDGKASYTRVAEAIEEVDARHKADRRNQAPVFWYSDTHYEDPHTREYRAVMCGFMSHEISLKHYPAVDSNEAKNLHSGDLLTILTPNGVIFESVAPTLAQHGFDARWVGQVEIKSGDGAFQVTYLRLRSRQAGGE